MFIDMLQAELNKNKARQGQIEGFHEYIWSLTYQGKTSVVIKMSDYPLIIDYMIQEGMTLKVLDNDLIHVSWATIKE